MTRPQAWLAPGLALTTFATLLVEILSTRLLSVLTWYHLSFLAVSLAMLGMASGAVFVFLRGDQARGDQALRLLGRATFSMAIAIPVVHLGTLVIPIPPLTETRLSLVLPLAVSIVLLSVPFFLSGVAVTIALTRLGAPIGRLYAWDLAGAAAGCLLRDSSACLHQPHVSDVHGRRGDSVGGLVFRKGGRTAASQRDCPVRRCCLESRDGTPNTTRFPCSIPRTRGSG